MRYGGADGVHGGGLLRDRLPGGGVNVVNHSFILLLFLCGRAYTPHLKESHEYNELLFE